MQGMAPSLILATGLGRMGPFNIRWTVEEGRRMEISATPRQGVITLRIEDVGDVELSLASDALGVYRTVVDTQRALETATEELRMRCEGADRTAQATAVLQYTVRCGDLQLEALRKAVGEDGWQRLEPVADRLPVPTISRLFSAVAQLAGESLVARLKEGRS